MTGPVFGHIPGYPVGSLFESRTELSEAGLHRHRQAGISGSASEGADSIVLSGGYEDDEDLAIRSSTRATVGETKGLASRS